METRLDLEFVFKTLDYGLQNALDLLREIVNEALYWSDELSKLTVHHKLHKVSEKAEIHPVTTDSAKTRRTNPSSAPIQTINKTPHLQKQSHRKISQSRREIHLGPDELRLGEVDYQHQANKVNISVVLESPDAKLPPQTFDWMGQ